MVDWMMVGGREGHLQLCDEVGWEINAAAFLVGNTRLTSSTASQS